MPINDELGKRMKENYENRAKTYLTRRMPVAIRIDGKAFHTFTRGFQKPFDKVLGNTMIKTMEYLCKNIQGCVFGYTQSDEITLILIDYQTLTTDAWFDYQVQKMCSIAASMATMAFNKFFEESVEEWCMENFFVGNEPNYKQWLEPYHIAKNKGAMFDARCFNIPKEEVCNLIYWRQLDATRNSIQMVGQANFSHEELQNKSQNDIQDMLYEQRKINWNDYPTRWKRGVACHKVIDVITTEEFIEEQEWGEPIVKNISTATYKWEVDYEMPILKGENRSYVEDMIFI